MIGIALFEEALRNPNILKQKGFLFGILISLIFLVGSFFYGSDTYGLRELLFGVGEKQHGLLLPISLGLLFFLLINENKKSLERMVHISLGAAFFVTIIAILENVLHYNIFTGSEFQNTGSWGTIRSTSTLGNPNYVAGYLLAHIPLLYYRVHRWEKYLGLALLVLGIGMTGSVIGMTLSTFFFMALILKKTFPKNWLPILFFLVITGGTVLSIYLSGGEKWLSLTSRFVLMGESLLGNINSPIHILVGQGPMGIIDYYEASRSLIIGKYFPSSMIIDSSHNIFIDFFFQYGFIGLVFLVYPIFYFWRNYDQASKWSIILLLSFLSLNVFVVSHLILFCLVLARNER
ncbi:MAG: hypothetical protein HHAS10_11100 [Candidatus Altimarinota bacterium]